MLAESRPILRRVKKTGCWEWTRAKTHDGYGHMTYRLGISSKAGSVLAHRLAYEITKGPIPAGMYVCHHCDNPPCVRPDHLFLGTQRDNVYDSIAKRRRRNCTPPKPDPNPCTFPKCTRRRHGRFCRSHWRQKGKYGEKHMRPIRDYYKVRAEAAE